LWDFSTIGEERRGAGGDEGANGKCFATGGQEGKEGHVRQAHRVPEDRSKYRRRKRRCTTSDRLRSACVQHALAPRGAVDEEAAGYDGGADGEASEDEAEQINEEEEVTGRRRRRP